MTRKAAITLGLVIVAVVLVGILLLRPPSGPSPEGEQAWPTLRIGYLPIAAGLPLFVAVEEGYFSDAGIEFELTRFASSNELGNAATADRIDILSPMASNVIFDIGQVSGKRHLVFATNPYSNTPGHVTDHLIVRAGSGIETLEGLRGHKVASFPGSVNRIFTYLILEKHGVPRDSYEYVELLPKDWEPSLQAGAIDALSALEPVATQIIRDGVGVSIFPGFYADLLPDVPLSAHWVAADFYARADKAQLAAFLDAFERAILLCKNEPERAKHYLTTYANVRPDILEDVNLNQWQTLSRIDPAHFQDFIDILAENEAIHARVDINDYILPDPRQQH